VSYICSLIVVTLRYIIVLEVKDCVIHGYKLQQNKTTRRLRRKQKGPPKPS